MKKIQSFRRPQFFIYIQFVCLSWIFFSCQSQNQINVDKIQIAASITPLADFARQIGGDRVHVFTIIPAGANQHTFELTPQLMQQITHSDLIIINGVGMEYWADNVIKVTGPATKIVNTSRNVELLEEDSALGHHYYNGNPHIWLDPIRAMQQVSEIRDALVQTDSLHADYYRSNAETYIRQLDTLNQNLVTEIQSWKYKKFICFHPAWEYFANRYGLEQAAVIQTSHDMTPGPREIVKIIKTAQAIKAKAIFTEAQFPDNVSRTIARESGIYTIALDPIGATQHFTSYMDMIQFNVQQMAKALKDD